MVTTLKEMPRLCLGRGISDYLFVKNGVECVFVCVCVCVERWGGGGGGRGYTSVGDLRFDMLLSTRGKLLVKGP